VSYFLTRGMLKDIYAAHYPEMERRFLQARNRPMTEIQQQRLQLIGDNLIVLQWRLRNAGLLVPEFTSTLTRSNEQVIALIARPNKDFPLFPGYIPSGTIPGPKPPRWKVHAAAGTPPQSTGDLSALNSNTFVIFAAQETQVRIVPRRISHGAYFAGYEIKDAAGKVIRSGIFNTGTPIVFPAKAGTAYYLSIPPRKPVHYELSIDNAAMAEGRLREDILTLYAPPAPILVFNAPGHAPIGVFDREGAVVLQKPFSGAAGRADMLRGGAYKDVKVIGSFDQGWRFSPDPKDELLNRGVTTPEFDDSGWATLSALDWWQMQGFEAYHGPAWYRMKFTAPPLEKGRSVRLYFGGVDGNAEVYLNGRKVVVHTLGKNHEGWDRPFSKSVAGTLKAGENILAVKVTSKNSTTASGIFRGVSLLTMVPTGKK
jgi:hypothetical protein